MKRAQLWPIAIVVVLALTVAANLWVMRVASADPSFAIEPDYYAQAVRWDSTLAQQARNRALGWIVRPRFVRDASGALALSATVVDGKGSEVLDARVQVTAFAIARSGERLDIQLTPSGRGYSGALDGGAMPGRWELHFDVRRGDERLTSNQRLELVAP
jgi:nitrogen fixation protein FixH